MDKIKKTFLSIVEAGLWNKEVQLSLCESENYRDMYVLAQQQAIVGLLAAGIEKLNDSGVIHVPQDITLQITGEVLQLEQRNRAMNAFVAQMIEQLRKVDVYALVMKGQGIAQCYEKPLWRACGDVDLLLSEGNYENIKKALIPISSRVDRELKKRKHLALTIDEWTVELHGTLRTNLWRSLDNAMDQIQREVFYGGNVRSWLDGNTQVFLLRQDEDVVFVFAHILQHFYIEGIGLRQICDWCRLLYTYKEKIDVKLLEQRVRKAGMMKEWKSFAALAVDYLGMPVEAMPFYDSKFNVQGSRVMELVMDSGNFGQGKDKSYKQNHSKGVSYMISFERHAKYGYRRFRLFPAHAMLMWWKLMMHGLKGVLGIGKNDGGL